MEPFIGMVMLVPYNRQPNGWLPCIGQSMSISGNSALYSLVGTWYGGNGTTHFALPNLQNICPPGMMYIIAIAGVYPQRS